MTVHRLHGRLRRSRCLDTAHAARTPDTSQTEACVRLSAYQCVGYKGDDEAACSGLSRCQSSFDKSANGLLLKR